MISALGRRRMTAWLRQSELWNDACERSGHVPLLEERARPHAVWTKISPLRMDYTAQGQTVGLAARTDTKAAHLGMSPS
jgi:hypothetical protein